MNHVTIPDLTKSPPRPGRQLLGGRYAWLARLADKVRAQHAGTNGEYVGYCALSRAYLEAAGVSEADFDALIDQGADDEDIVKYFDARVDQAHRDASNKLMLEEHSADLNRQDAQEGYTPRS